MKVKTPKKDPQAVGAYAGFSLQPTRMALLLLKAADDSVVSMELFDDVGVEESGGAKLAVQTKGGWSGNPLTNRSPELWKTFANWTRDVRNGKLDPTQTIFELYVNRKVKPGSIPLAFSELETKEQAIEEFRVAKTLLWGHRERDRDKTPPSLKPHLEEVFGSGAKYFQSLLPRFQITLPVKSPEADLETEFKRSLTIEPVHLHSLIKYTHGWLKTEIDKQTATGQSPTITRESFKSEMLKIYRMLNPSGNLPDLSNHPSEAEIKNLFDFIFVKQLTIIDLDEESKNFAMNCFFRSGTTRTRWSDADLIHEEELAELDRMLSQAHRDFFTEIFSSEGLEITKAKRLLSKCNQHRCSINGKGAPEYFIPGCFHALADRLVLGWHPEYKKMLNKGAT